MKNKIIQNLIGKKKSAFYKILKTNGSKKIKKNLLGYYNPINKDIKLNLYLLVKYMNTGSILSKSNIQLLKRYNIIL